MAKNIIITAFAACNIWLCIVLVSNKQKYNSELSLIQAKTMTACNDQITDAFLKTLKYENTRFSISDNAKEIITSCFSVKNNSKIFYRLSFPYCESCIFPVIDKLVKAFPEKEDDIIIISSFPTNEYSEEFNKAMQNKNLKVINIPDVEFYLDRNNFNGSYLFMMDYNFNHKKLFFTNKCNQFITNSYIKFLEREKQ